MFVFKIYNKMRTYFDSKNLNDREVDYGFIGAKLFLDRNKKCDQVTEG